MTAIPRSLQTASESSTAHIQDTWRLRGGVDSNRPEAGTVLYLIMEITDNLFFVIASEVSKEFYCSRKAKRGIAGWPHIENEV